LHVVSLKPRTFMFDQAHHRGVNDNLFWGTVNLSGRGQPDLGGQKMSRVSRYPMPQISAQRWKLWRLEALCSAAVAQIATEIKQVVDLIGR
jgi:hypothetical protein